MQNLSHFDEKSQSFWPTQVGRYVLCDACAIVYCVRFFGSVAWMHII